MTGRIRAVQAEAPHGKQAKGGGHLWRPIEVPLRDARRLLASWERRDVPWLDAIHRVEQLSTFDEVQAHMQSLEAELSALRERISTGGIDTRGVSDLRPTVAVDTGDVEEVRFTAAPNPAAAVDEPESAGDGS